MRTGLSVRQPGRFRAFVPAAFPPSPPLKLDTDLAERLTDASLALGRLDGVAALLSDPGQFLRDFAGVETDATEIRNHVDALSLGVERLTRQPFSKPLLLELHRRLLTGAARGQDRAPGSFRTTQNWLGTSNRWDPNQVHFYPPPVAEMHAALDDLVAFMNHKTSGSPLLQAGLVYSQFETIHPFLDGNGRMGRLLVPLLLHHRGMLTHPVLYLGRHQRRLHWLYARKLQATRSRGDLEGWMAFFLESVRDASREQVEAASALVRRTPGPPAVTPSSDSSLDSGSSRGNDIYGNQHPLAGPVVPHASESFEDRMMSQSEPSAPRVEAARAAGIEPIGGAPADLWEPLAPAAGVAPSACGCAACSSSPARGENIVFALGTVSYDLVTEARAESIQAHMGADPTDNRLFLNYLEKHPWEAASVTWTLQLDQSPLYAILPGGPFAAEGFQRLRTFLAEHAAEETERVSIPGRISGRSTLLNGQVVDVIVPELRGMASWTTKALVEAVAGQPLDEATATQAAHAVKVEGVRNFLHRVYYELRNLGVTAEERAINFAATNASKVAGVFHLAAADFLELDTLSVERSPICRPGSECWDVKMTFFYPDRPVQSVRKAYRFTVDVSDVVPVLVGPIRSWSVR